MSSNQKPFSSAGGFDARGKQGTNFKDPENLQDAVTLNYLINNSLQSSGPIFIKDILPTSEEDGVVNTVDPVMNVVTSTKVSGSTIDIILYIERGDRSDYIPFIKWNTVEDLTTATLDNDVNNYQELSSGGYEVTLRVDTVNTNIYIWNGNRIVTLAITKSVAPIITSAIITSPYPTTNSTIQSEVKSGDTLDLTIESDKDIKTVVVKSNGLFAERTFNFSGIGTTRLLENITVSHNSNLIATNLGFQVYITDTEGVTSSIFSSNINGIEGTDYMKGNNLKPSFPNGINVAYPATQGAIKSGENSTVTCNVINYTEVQYNTPLNELSVANNTTYLEAKSATYSSGGYNITNPNYSLTAIRNNNGTVLTISTIVNIANTSLTGIVSPTNISSSLSGLDTLLTTSTSQKINSIESYSISGLINNTISNQLISDTVSSGEINVIDTDVRGNKPFEVQLNNLANITTTITQDINVSGFSARNVSLLGSNNWVKVLIGVLPTNVSNLEATAVVGSGASFPITYDSNITNVGDTGSDTGNPNYGLEFIGNDSYIIIDSNLQALALGNPNKDITINIKQNA